MGVASAVCRWEAVVDGQFGGDGFGWAHVRCDLFLVGENVGEMKSYAPLACRLPNSETPRRDPRTIAVVVIGLASIPNPSQTCAQSKPSPPN